MKFQIEKAASDHIDDVLSIAAECGLSVWSRDEYIKEVNGAETLFYVAAVRDRAVGFIVGRLLPSTTSDGYLAEVFNIGVSREFRRARIGSELISIFRIAARDRGAVEAYLEVRSGNLGAIEFYKKHGFDVYSERRGYYADPPDDATLMRSKL